MASATPAEPDRPAGPLYIGLMSGTSLDGVDGVLVRFAAAHDSGPPSDSTIDDAFQVLQHVALPLPPPLRAELLALNTRGGTDELHRAALAGNALSRLYAQAVHELVQAAGIAPGAVRAIGAHGQTVRHQPGAFDGTGYTLQLQNPALLAEIAGIDVVADFRSRDLAAGGQGAPLVPAFHQARFGQKRHSVAVLNIGGIANISVLPPGNAPSGPVRGFDCGPGNALLDYWCQRHTGAPFDAGGAWAMTGAVLPSLLARMLAEPFLRQPPPKSTGRDLFNPQWLHRLLAQEPPAVAADVQATLTEFTVRACASCIVSYAKDSAVLIVCGGGAFNTALVQGLARALPHLRVESSAVHGLPPLQVEAAAFAWLARCMVERRPGNLPAVTGAAGARVLGAMYPA